MAPERRRLGRGLDALLGKRPAAANSESASSATSRSEAPFPVAGHGFGAADGEPRLVSVAAIHPNPYQPRQEIAGEELHALAQSIRRNGLLQPIVVRSRGDRFELVAGERRWRASIEAGLEHIPAVVRVADDRQMLEWALIENLQRENLNPVERAKAYERYCREFSLTAERLAERLAEDRSTVANYLRILDLSDAILAMLSRNELSMGHARCLLAVAQTDKRERLAKHVARSGMSVRATEAMVRKERVGSPDADPELKLVSPKDANLRDLENRLQQIIGTRVAIKPGKAKNRGRIVIDYYNLDDFERISKRLGMTSPP
jgi:ParB family transcriptional regulator, chromosome partitioning protein